MEGSNTKPKYGRNWKRLVVIYLAVGAVVYGVIYLLLQAGNGSSGGGLYG